MAKPVMVEPRKGGGTGGMDGQTPNYVWPFFLFYKGREAERAWTMINTLDERQKNSSRDSIALQFKKEERRKAKSEYGKACAKKRRDARGGKRRGLSILVESCNILFTFGSDGS